MDLTWLLVALILVVLFTAISIVGVLRRIQAATEKTLAILEAQEAAENTSSSR